MRIDDLTRELDEQAAAAMAASPVGMDALRRRRTRARRRAAVAGGSVAVLAVTLGVALAGGTTPGAGPVAPGPSSTTSTEPSPSPAEPTPSPSPSVTGAAGASGWEAIDCSPSSSGACELPETVTVDGRRYTELGGASGSQPVRLGSNLYRELGLSVVPTGEPVLVVAGATGTGPGSQLAVSVNWERSKPLPGPELSAHLLKVTPDSQKVVVQELGRPGPDETLQLKTYLPAG